MSRRSTRYNKRDANELLILATLASCSVEWIEAGPLDGWVHLGEWIPVEIKMPTGKLTESQEDFITACHYWGRKYMIWRSAEEALKAVQAWKRE
jgi:hypothetical protein